MWTKRGFRHSFYIHRAVQLYVLVFIRPCCDRCTTEIRDTGAGDHPVTFLIVLVHNVAFWLWCRCPRASVFPTDVLVHSLVTDILLFIFVPDRTAFSSHFEFVLILE